MDSSESSERQQSEEPKTLDTTPPKQSDSDYTYEDDFEELDSSVHEKSRDSTLSNAASVTNTTDNSSGKAEGSKSDTAATSDSDSQAQKGQRESSREPSVGKDSSTDDSTDSSSKPQTPSAFDDPQSDDSEPEPEGDVLFTDDQQRAMMELMAQKHDSGDYSDDPPEYNVKERLKELNAELAMEPDPDDRHHRVGFKAELVDLVAPPPEVSDDEDSAKKSNLDDGDKAKASAGGEEKEKGGDKKKQFVVERDGKFDVVADNELTSSERAMFNIPDNRGSNANSKTGAKDGQIRTGGGDNSSNANNSNSQESRETNIHPTPPSKPRPSTANGYSRRNVRPAQSPPRPHTASSSRHSSSNTPAMLQDFNYNSPYAMSPNEKERAQEQARLRERQKKEDEESRKQEEEYKRQESEDAFHAWLRHKREDDRRRREETDERKRASAKEDKSKESETENEGYPNIPYLEPFEPIIKLKSQENEEAFKGWLKTKQTQVKREKLLKRREEQEVKDGYYVRSREECDQAYKEWLRKKYADIRRQRAVEKQRTRSYRSNTRKSRKQQMMARAVRQAQAFRYVDYYGYRF